jgi:hypothetical protein
VATPILLLALSKWIIRPLERENYGNSERASAHSSVIVMALFS